MLKSKKMIQVVLLVLIGIVHIVEGIMQVSILRQKLMCKNIALRLIMNVVIVEKLSQLNVKMQKSIISINNSQ